MNNNRFNFNFNLIILKNLNLVIFNILVFKFTIYYYLNISICNNIRRNLIIRQFNYIKINQVI